MITLEGIFSPDNLNLALRKVKDNKGAPGIDGLKVEDFPKWFYDHPFELTNAIMDGTYKPKPIKRVYIPKDNGDKRPLGIPCVLDRIVQQAIAQALTAEYDSKFSESSYGFRPNKSPIDAVNAAIEYLNDGYCFVVDLDLEKFFDTVSHSKILRLLSENIKDGRVISLISKILKTKIVDGNTVTKPKCGVTQGAPCSPILANILLDLLDKELERRGHKFCRFADDVIILCKSRKAALRTYESIKQFIEEKLLLKINEEKSSVQKINPKVKFLGFAFYYKRSKTNGKDTSGYIPVVHKKIKIRLHNTIKSKFLTRQLRCSIASTKLKLTLYLMGWAHFFARGITKTNMKRIEQWLRHRIRMTYIIAWKKNSTKESEFIKLKTASKKTCHIVANSSLGKWAKSLFANKVITNKVIHEQWGWPSIYKIVETKAWTILGY